VVRVELVDQSMISSSRCAPNSVTRTYKTPQRLDAGGPRIRISGTMEYARLKIRHKAH
jgi:hypothetical protein